jgi:hypothetical protein
MSALRAAVRDRIRKHSCFLFSLPRGNAYDRRVVGKLNDRESRHQRLNSSFLYSST